MECAWQGCHREAIDREHCAQHPTELIGFRIGRDLLERIDAEAGRRDETRSEFMRHIFRSWVLDREADER